MTLFRTLFRTLFGTLFGTLFKRLFSTFFSNPVTLFFIFFPDPVTHFGTDFSTVFDGFWGAFLNQSGVVRDITCKNVKLRRGSWAEPPQTPPITMSKGTGIC